MSTSRDPPVKSGTHTDQLRVEATMAPYGNGAATPTVGLDFHPRVSSLYRDLVRPGELRACMPHNETPSTTNTETKRRRVRVRGPPRHSIPAEKEGNLNQLKTNKTFNQETMHNHNQNSNINYTIAPRATTGTRLNLIGEENCTSLR